MKKIIPHVTLILGLMTLTFFVISRFNDAMAFMTSSLSQWVFALLAVAAIITSIYLIGENLRAARRADKKQAQRQQAAKQRQQQQRR